MPLMKQARYVSVSSWQMSMGLKVGLVISLLPVGATSVGECSIDSFPGLRSFRMDWLDLLAVHQTLQSLLQHQSSKASILWFLAFLVAQLLHPYMTTGKTIALTICTFVGKVMSLLSNMLSRLVIVNRCYYPQFKEKEMETWKY
uniref:Uncharacterized protein n=1 Tax=Ovis aries TaxID=9940 RepID=A0AC11ECN2_SHEEP